jgi:ubiquinone/menaquinone biosynthesis C-methylase UbiE
MKSTKARPQRESPLESDVVDTVVIIWTLCSITEPLAALRELRSAVKPSGALLFVEHNLAPDPQNPKLAASVYSQCGTISPAVAILAARSTT